MRALIPDDLPWEITNSSDDSGRVTDVTVLVTQLDGDPAFSIRTIERPGERFASEGASRGVLTDRASVASVAVLGLLLEAIPQGAPDEMTRSLRSASRRAADIGLTSGEWSPERLTLAGVDYAIRVHRMDEGYAAVADLGPTVVALWGPSSPAGVAFSLHSVE